MASSNVIILGLLAVGGFYAYTQGWLCQLNIPQLCPGSVAPTTTAGLRTRPVPNEGDVPINDIVWRTQGHQAVGPGRGYGDDGYGDYYESNAAHISIA